MNIRDNDRGRTAPLLALSLLLAVLGAVLLSGALPHTGPARPGDGPVARGTTPPPPPSPSAASSTSAGAGRASAASRADAGAPSRAASAARSPRAADTARETPPPLGEGKAGDRAIQRLLDRTWPSDLPHEQERQLLAAGRALLRADATGVGRERFPSLYPRGEAVVPAFARFRIQAAVARRDGPRRARVHLVWAGADRGGTYTEGRIADLHFTRTTAKKGEGTWTPLGTSTS